MELSDIPEYFLLKRLTAYFIPQQLTRFLYDDPKNAPTHN